MRLILEQEEKQQKEKTIFEAMEYDECVVEYLDNEIDVEKILIVKDDNLDNIVVFWRLSVYTYSLSSGKQEVYEQIKNDYLMKKIVDIYPVLSSVTFERIKK